MLATSAWGWWSVESALRWAAGALVAALVGIGFLAVRRIGLSWRCDFSYWVGKPCWRWP